MKMKVVFLVFALCVNIVIGHINCIGTCYSGRLFPEPQDISQGWHLKGFSYKNITTDNPRKCYSSCTQDCRCKACQMKDARCELLDEDKTSKNDSFVEESGYVYYDLKQTMYQGESHMLPPGVCQNGCCRSQPCLNGGTCIEHCDSPKDKFTCKCAGGYAGKICKIKLTPVSCLDVLKWSPKGVVPSNGIYIIENRNGIPNRNVYCDFTTPNEAWTLITSFRFDQNYVFKRKAFFQLITRSESSPNFNLHRIRLSLMKSIRARSTLYRATCNFEKRFQTSLIPDLLIGNLSDYDIMNDANVDGLCIKYLRANIRGYEFKNVMLTTWHKRDSTHMHIGYPFYNNCGFSIPGIVTGEACFGFYGYKHPDFTCSKTADSTTNWWMGGTLNDI